MGSSSSRSYSGSLQSKGGCWQNKLRFVTYDGYNVTEEDYNASDLHFLKEEEGFDEPILEVQALKRPLIELQITMSVFYHMFIVFSTRSWHWSIEKDAGTITLQRSRNKCDVKSKLCGQPRKGKTGLIKHEVASRFSIAKNMLDVVDLYESYHVIWSNCQKFGSEVYKKLSGNTLTFHNNF